MVLTLFMQCVVLCGPTSDRNAADEWYALFEKIHDMETPQIVGEMTPEAKLEYKRLLPLIRQVRTLALRRNCDWNIDYSAGPGTELTHLSSIRKVSLLIQYSIQADMKAGDITSALEGVHSLLGLSHQLKTGQTLVESLVSASSFAFATSIDATLIGAATDPKQLEPIYQSIEELGSFDPFGVRLNIGLEGDMMLRWLESETALEEYGIDISASDRVTEVANYTEVMDQVVAIFALTDKLQANNAALALQTRIEAGEYGRLVELITPSLEPLLKAAFRTASEVDEFKKLVGAKLKMLRSPNAAIYFFQAVDAYALIAAQDRVQAVTQRQFEFLDAPLQLLAIAANMEPTILTLGDDPAVPMWLAPVYAMTIDGLVRGSTSDIFTAIQVAGHLSMQNRFAASIAAASIMKVVIDTLPEHMESEEREQMLAAVRRIPSADAYMLQAAVRSDVKRFISLFEIKEGWKPKPDVVLAATLTLAQQHGVEEQWPIVWPLFVDTLGVPDDEVIVAAAVREHIPDALLVVSFEQSNTCIELLRNASKELLSFRKLLTTRPRVQ